MITIIPVKRSQDNTALTMTIQYAITDSESTHSAEMISIALQENATRINQNAAYGLEERILNNATLIQTASLTTVKITLAVKNEESLARMTMSAMDT